MIAPRRQSRFLRVIQHRVRHVHCAIEHVHHRHNTSAILRSCDALGLHHVHLVGGTRFRASPGPARGADRWLDLQRHTTTEEAIAALKVAGVALWVADLADPPVPPQKVPLDRPVCLWFGAEVVGVSEAAREAADGVVTVPMHGFAQSLNVSVAAALTMHVVTERARELLGDEALLTPTEQEELLASWIAREREELDAEAARAEALTLLGRDLAPADDDPR